MKETFEGKGNVTKVLLTGANGQLGRALVRLGSSKGFEIHGFSRIQLDITHPDEFQSAVKRIQPQCVVNAAAFTSVDQAESDSTTAYSVNGTAPGRMAEICAGSGIRMVQISTDFVFDGRSPSLCLPEDPPAPLNVYGKSKLVGERAVLDALGDKAIILRTAWVYSRTGPCFVTAILGRLQEGGKFKVVNDQIGSPTSADSLARAVLGLVKSEASGLMHWTNAGAVSRFDFALAIRDVANRLRLLPSRCGEIVPVSSAEYRLPAERPARVVLSCESSIQAGAGAQPDWCQELKHVMEVMKS